MDLNNFQTFMQALLNRLERQEAQVTTTNQVLVELVGEVRNLRQDGQQFQQQQSRFNQLILDWTDRQEAFNKRQEQFNERQDQFNTIFLDEIRDIKLDVRELRKDLAILKDVTLKQYDDRLKKPEDFMDNFMRKAG